MEFILAISLAVLFGAWIGYVIYPVAHPYEPEDDDFFDDCDNEDWK